MPSIQWLIRAVIPKDSLTIVGINASSSVTWLKNFASERGISFSMVYDSKGVLYKDYEVGATYGNTPPTEIIIDKQGIIRYRIDDQFNKASEMLGIIRQLLKGGA